MRFTDRSRTELDWKCPRARFWSTEHEGRGLSPATDAEAQVFGKLLHETFDAFARHPGPSSPARDLAPKLREALLNQIAAVQLVWDRTVEQANIGEGLLWGFARHVWPLLMRDHDVVSPEVEVTYPLSPRVTFMARPDLILRRRDDGTFWYVEYKTTGWNDNRWINSWLKAVQLHSGVFAARHTLHLPIEGAIIVGLYKGYRSRDEERRFMSPLAYGWRDAGAPAILSARTSYTFQRGKGWERAATHTLPGGLEGWLAGMPLDLLREQFPTTGPIFLREDLVDAFFRQRAEREDALALWHDAGRPDAALDTLFPQQFFSCQPAFGYSCAFNDLCWNGAAAAAPLDAGFRVREPHHAPEQEALSRG